MRKQPRYLLLLSASVLFACSGDDATDDEVGDTGTETGTTDEETTTETTTTEETTTDTTDETTTDTTETTDETTDTTEGGPVCGDGAVDMGEECDDGNVDNHDDCLDDCTAASCGDGFIAAGLESCDEGDPDDGSGCSAVCEVELYSRCVGEGPDSCNPIRILFALAFTDSPAYRMDVAMVTGGVVDYFSASNGTPALMDLQTNYDCVVTYQSSSYDDSMAMGTVLRDYVDAGGNVVLGIATDYNQPAGLNGTPIMADGYSPISTSGTAGAGGGNYAGDGVTVIHTGVMAYGVVVGDNAVTLQGSGVADGTYGVGKISGAYRPDYKVVYLNGSGDLNFGASGQWGLLTANACAAGYFVQP